jgi:hypothetical protein
LPQKITILQVIICDELRKGSMLNSGNNDREQNWLLLSQRLLSYWSHCMKSKINIFVRSRAPARVSHGTKWDKISENDHTIAQK